MKKIQTEKKEFILNFLSQNENLRKDFLNCKNPEERMSFLMNLENLKEHFKGWKLTKYLTYEIYKTLLENKIINYNSKSKLPNLNSNNISMKYEESDSKPNCRENTTSIDFNSSLQQTFIFDSDSSKSNKSDEIKPDTLSNEKLIDSSEPKEITLIGSEIINYQKEIDRLSDSLTKLSEKNSEFKEVINSFTNLNNKTTDISNKNKNSLESDSLREIKHIASLRSISSQKTDISISTDLLRKVTLIFVENKIIDPTSLAIENINAYSLITETILLKFINQNSFL